MFSFISFIYYTTSTRIFKCENKTSNFFLRKKNRKDIRKMLYLSFSIKEKNMMNIIKYDNIMIIYNLVEFNNITYYFNNSKEHFNIKYR